MMPIITRPTRNPPITKNLLHFFASLSLPAPIIFPIRISEAFAKPHIATVERSRITITRLYAARKLLLYCPRVAACTVMPIPQANSLKNTGNPYFKKDGIY